MLMVNHERLEVGDVSNFVTCVEDLCAWDGTARHVVVLTQEGSSALASVARVFVVF